MPDDDDTGGNSSDAGPARAPGFLIPPGYPQVISIDFNTLLNHGHVTPEVLEHLTGLLGALQDSFREAVPRRLPPAPAPPPGVPTPGAPSPVSYEFADNDCPELGLQCPAASDICPADCASDYCSTHCDGYVPYCSGDDFTPVGCPPACRDAIGCDTYDQEPPPECPTKLEPFVPDPGGECSDKVITR